MLFQENGYNKTLSQQHTLIVQQMLKQDVNAKLVLTA